MCYFIILLILSLMAHRASLHSVNTIFYNHPNNESRSGSCRLRTIREAPDQRSESSMTESFVFDDIEYKFCRYHVTWDEAQVFCSTHKAHLATLDNNEKITFIVQAMAASNFLSEDYWIGARKSYKDVWTWDSNKKVLSSSMNIIDNVAIFYPGVESNDVRCLTIDRMGHDAPAFVSRSCNQQRGFICQRDTDRILDTKIRMVAASRIGDKEFRLFAGRATWAEAVVQCREEGLQVAEVKSVKEAQTLAVSMLRNRPELRHVWTDGQQTKYGQWRWEINGQVVPAFGRSFMPWCSDDKNNYALDLNCLSLDRDNLDTPLVYGLSCNEKQPYVCQPLIGECVSHSTVSSTNEPEVKNSEGVIMSKLKIEPSGSSGTMSMEVDDYKTPSTTHNSNRFLKDGLHDSVLGNLSTADTTSVGNVSDYFTPLPRFTFPSFPHFGIKLASALETSTKPFVNFENQRTKKVKEIFKTSLIPKKLTISTTFPTIARKYLANTKKSSQVALNKNLKLFFTTSPTNFETSTFKRATKALTKFSQKLKLESSTIKPINNTSGPPKYFSSSSNPKTQQYTQSTSKELISNSAPKIVPKMLKRITTPLSKKRRKFRLTTSSITPYDAIDEDYYDNYETTKVPAHDKESSLYSDTEYEQDYHISEKIQKEKKVKGTSNSNGMKNHTTEESSKKNYLKKKNREKFSIPIAGELSKSLQTALLGMLTEGVSRKISESKNTTVISTTLLPNTIENSRDSLQLEDPSKKVKENWFIPPYYAFEGPMVVGLSENSSQFEKPKNGNVKIHDFKFVGKMVPELSENMKLKKSKTQDNRGNRFHNSGMNKNIAYQFSLPISGDLTIANDPNDFLGMGKYFKNKYGNFNTEKVEENWSHDESKGSADNYGNTIPKNWTDENLKYAINKYNGGDSNLRMTYDKNGRRIITRRRYEAAYFPPLSKSFEKSRQEELKVSWPIETFSHSNKPIFGSTVSEGNFPLQSRITRSSGESSKIVKVGDPIFGSFPDFKLFRFMKKVKVDFDYEAFQKYLESSTDKITSADVFQYRKEGRENSRIHILAQISKILDRRNFNVNGDFLKVHVDIDDDKQIQKSATDIVELLKYQRKPNSRNFKDNVGKKMEK